MTKFLEYQGKRILTSSQLAKAYEVDPSIIAKNFNRNKERYIIGKHYFVLAGTEKDKFLAEVNLTPANQQPAYLWTEKGAFLHAKSINNDRAWSAYDQLIDKYYELQTALVQPQEIDTQLISLVEKSAEKLIEHFDQRFDKMEQSIEIIKEDVSNLKQDVQNLKIANVITHFFDEKATLADLIDSEEN